MGRCRGPVNRLIMMRKRGLSGPLFQHVGGGTCVKSVGNFHDVNGPGGSGLRFVQGWTGNEGCAA